MIDSLWGSYTIEPLREIAYHISHGSDSRYNGEYVNTGGEMWNGYPVYRNLDRRDYLIFMFSLPSLWVLQPGEPSSAWLANAYGYGESPETASWHSYVDLNIQFRDMKHLCTYNHDDRPGATSEMRCLAGPNCCYDPSGDHCYTCEGRRALDESTISSVEAKLDRKV